MYKKKTYDQKHLTTSQRIHIEKGLNDGLSFAAIARKLDKHPSTIAKEVKKYRTFQNGVEFQFPERLECDKNGEIRTKIFYCNPNSSWQKGRIEKNHEYIRYVIPKGQSLDSYKQRDACILMNHINSEARDSLNGCTPFRLSKMLLNNKLHRLLCLQEISADEVSLKPSLLKK